MSHSDPRTMPRLSQHPCRLEHCWRFRNFPGHYSKSSFTECITESCQTRCSCWSVSSSSSVQHSSSLVSSPSGASCSRSLTHPSLGHNLAGCPLPPHTLYFRPFSLAFGLSSTLAFAFALHLVPLKGSSCFLGLLPRLAAPRRVPSLWCVQPLSSRGRFLGPLTLFTFSFALPLRSRKLGAFRQLRSKTLRAGRSWCHSLLRSLLPRSPTSSL